MSRCRACNRILDVIEIKRTKIGGELEDLCSICLKLLGSTFNILEKFYGDADDESKI